MNRMNQRLKFFVFALLAIGCFLLLWNCSPARSPDAGPLKALIVNGQCNRSHNWKVSSPILKQLLEQTGLFNVDIATSPPAGGDMENFRPDFATYNVVVLDYEGDSWPEQTENAFVKYVKSGGGVVVYHAADNAFPEWKEFNEIIGLGGWGNRDERSGPYVRFRDGKVVLDNSPGRGGSHPPAHEYQVVTRDREHPITKDLPEKWMRAADELYSELRGPAKNLTVLATAYADTSQRGGTGEHEPVLFTIKYGKGRVFHDVFGHVGPRDSSLIPAMDCVGFIVTFQRGAEWAATGKVTQKVPEDFPTATVVRRWKGYKPPSLGELLEEIGTYQYGQSREPLTALTRLVRSAYDSPQDLKLIERRLLEVLQSDATLAGKQFVCRQLSISGTEEAVPTLAAMLTDAATSDMARYALERIPGAAADEAFRKALPKARGEVTVGIINSLGQRRDSQSVTALRSLVYDANAATAMAAVAALGRIADPQATEALAEASGKTTGKLRRLVLDSYLKCADQLVAQGEQPPAKAIYRQLYVPGEPVPVRAAALTGMVLAEAGNAAEEIVNVLRGGDPDMEPVAIGLVREIPRTQSIMALAGELASLSVAGQVQLLAALADRDDPACRDAVLAATESDKADVRIAALKALAMLGNDSTVPLLAQAAASGSATEREVARGSLNRLRGPETNTAIIAGIPQADPKVKAELVRSAGERRIYSAVETLLKTAKDSDRDVRIESIKALRLVADPDELPALIDLLIQAPDDAERQEAENTVVAVAHKIARKDRQAKAVLDALRPVKDTVVRGSLLQVLANIGDSKALPVLRKALKDRDDEIKLAAIRSLSNWPTAEPLADLLNVARTSENEIHRVLALRGHIRLIGLDSDRSEAETLKLYQEAMDLASAVSEKKMVLSELTNMRTVAALEMAADCLDDSALQQEAGVAVGMIARSTVSDHPQETRKALEKVIQVTENDQLRKQIQQFIDQMK